MLKSRQVKRGSNQAVKYIQMNKLRNNVTFRRVIQIYVLIYVEGRTIQIPTTSPLRR